MSDHNEFPDFALITEMRVEPGGTASSAPIRFCFAGLGSLAEELPFPDTNFT